MQVTNAELSSFYVDREEDLASATEILDVAVTTMLGTAYRH